jgi:hypothetical protein
MCKKFAFTAVALVAIAAVLGFTKVGSYVTTGWGKFTHAAKQQVPIEFEIERIKGEIAKLIPDLRKNLSVVAEQMASVDRLEREVTAKKANLDKQEVALRKMAQHLLTNDATYVNEGREFSRDVVARKFELDKKAFKNAQDDLKVQEQILALKRKELENAKAKLEEIRAQEQSLKLEIQALETDLQTVRLQETKNKFVVDDSRLGEVKKSIEELRYRLDTETKKAALEAEYFGNDMIEGAEKPAAKPASESAREFLRELDGNKTVEK